jgi:hypothetical protein
MNWTPTQQREIRLAVRGVVSLQDLEKEFGLPVARAMWNEVDRFFQLRKARKYGKEVGTAAAAWVVDGNTPLDLCRHILTGIEKGDPEVMAWEPAILSGEYADGLTVGDVLREAGVPPLEERPAGWDYSDVLGEFSESFSSAYWDTVQTACENHLG